MVSLDKKPRSTSLMPSPRLRMGYCQRLSDLQPNVRCSPNSTTLWLTAIHDQQCKKGICLTIFENIFRREECRFWPLLPVHFLFPCLPSCRPIPKECVIFPTFFMPVRISSHKHAMSHIINTISYPHKAVRSAFTSFNCHGLRVLWQQHFTSGFVESLWKIPALKGGRALRMPTRPNKLCLVNH